MNAKPGYGIRRLRKRPHAGRLNAGGDEVRVIGRVTDRATGVSYTGRL